MFLVMFPFVHGWWCGACGSASLLYVVLFSSHRVSGLCGLSLAVIASHTCSEWLFVSFMCRFVLCGFVDQASSLRLLRSVVGIWFF